MGKVFDNRLGSAAVIQIIKTLHNEDLGINIVVGGAVQEEVGTRGAEITANVIKPDIAIVLMYPIINSFHL